MALLLHNPRCSKSREALRMLEEAGVQVGVREYLKQPLSLDELRLLKKKLRLEPKEWIRFNEDEAAGLSPDDPPMELLAAVARHPKLLQRPILVGEEDAVVGRPPERVLELVGAER